MDTSELTTFETIKQTKRRRRSLEGKRRIVEEPLESGASVARVARRHAVMRAAGEVAGGPDQIHLALKDVLTAEGTLMM